MTESIDRRLSTTATASVARSRPRARWYNMERNPPALSAFTCRPSYWEAGK